MSTNLLTISPHDTLDKVREVFMSNNIHHLPVVADDKLVGILTTYDLWKTRIAPEDYASTYVDEVMTRKIAKVGPEEKIGSAAEIFLANKFHALPVVDDNDRLVGLVTTFDILLYNFKKEYPKPILFKHLYDTEDD